MPVNTRNTYSSAPRQSGWSAASITPRSTTMVNNTAPTIPAVPAMPPTTPITPADLQTGSTAGLADPTLGSRQYTSVPGGHANVLAQTSVYETPNAPAFLANQVAALNAQQAMRKQFQDQLVNQLLGYVGSNNPNAYLYAGALQAAVAQPGSGGGGGFGFPQNPLIGQGYNAASQAQAKLLSAQTEALNRPQQIANQIAELKRRKASYAWMGSSMFGNSDVASIDQQIFDLQGQLTSAQSMANRAAGASSGWTSSPVLPGF